MLTFPQLIVQDSVTISTNNFTFLHLSFQLLKTHFSSESSDTEQFILFISVMEIENSVIIDTTSVAPFSLFVFRKPFVMTSDEGLFCPSITISTFTTPIHP